MKDRVQSIADPSPFRSSIVAAGKTSIQCIGSANFGISRSGMPIFRRISHCFGSFSATRSAAPRIGRPVQWNPCGWRTLYPSIRRYRDWNSARRNDVPNPMCWYPFMYGYGTVENHFGREGSARATYTSAFSQAACHRAWMLRRSTFVLDGFRADRGLREWAERRGPERDGPRPERILGGAGFALRVLRAGDFPRFGAGRGRDARPREVVFLRATPGHRRRLRKAFSFDSPVLAAISRTKKGIFYSVDKIETAVRRTGPFPRRWMPVSYVV